MFEKARASASVEGYHEFLREFEGGSFEARARGNLAYLEAGGLGGAANNRLLNNSKAFDRAPAMLLQLRRQLIGHLCI